jgi:hypothetical protein
MIPPPPPGFEPIQNSAPPAPPPGFEPIASAAPPPPPAGFEPIAAAPKPPSIDPVAPSSPSVPPALDNYIHPPIKESLTTPAISTRTMTAGTGATTSIPSANQYVGGVNAEGQGLREDLSRAGASLKAQGQNLLAGAAEHMVRNPESMALATDPSMGSGLPQVLPPNPITPQQQTEAATELRQKQRDTAQASQRESAQIQNPVVKFGADQAMGLGVPMAAAAVNPALGAMAAGVTTHLHTQQSIRTELEKQGQTEDQSYENSKGGALGAAAPAAALMAVPGAKGVKGFVQAGAVTGGLDLTNQVAQLLATGKSLKDINWGQAGGAFAFGTVLHGGFQALHVMFGGKPPAEVQEKMAQAKTPEQVEAVVQEARNVRPNVPPVDAATSLPKVAEAAPGEVAQKPTPVQVNRAEPPLQPAPPLTPGRKINLGNQKIDVSDFNIDPKAIPTVDAGTHWLRPEQNKGSLELGGKKYKLYPSPDEYAAMPPGAQKYVTKPTPFGETPRAEPTPPPAASALPAQSAPDQPRPAEVAPPAVEAQAKPPVEQIAPPVRETSTENLPHGVKAGQPKKITVTMPDGTTRQIIDRPVKSAPVWKDVTPEGYGPSENPDLSGPDPQKPRHMSREEMRVVTSINEAKTLLRGNMLPGKRKMVLRALANSETKLAEIRKGLPPEPLSAEQIEQDVPNKKPPVNDTAYDVPPAPQPRTGTTDTPGVSTDLPAKTSPESTPAKGAAFTPEKIPYTTDAGKEAVLVIDRHRGHKSYWVEDAQGKKITKPAFYNEDAVRLIREKAEAAPPQKLEAAGGSKFAKPRGGYVNIEPIAKGVQAVRETAQHLKDATSLDPVPRLSRVGAGDAAVEHASAHVAVPHMVDDLLSKVFPSDYHNPEAMAKTIDIINKDNILGGYDSFVARAAEAAKAGDEAAATKYQAMADAVKGAHDLDALDAEVKSAPADVVENIKRWKKEVNPTLDQLFNEIKAEDSNTPREGRGRNHDARINLLAIDPETGETLSKMPKTKDGKPIVGATGSPRNPAAKRDLYDRAATFTGQYSTNASDVLSRVLGRRWNEVTKLRLYGELQAKAGAVMTDLGTDGPGTIKGLPARRLEVEVPETVDGKTRQVKKALWLPANMVREVRDVLATDQSLPENVVAKKLTAIQLLSPVDFTAHLKNMHSVLANAQGAKSVWADVVRKMPVLKSMDTVGRSILTFKEIFQDKPAIRAEIADMAKKGLIRPEYPPSGVQKILRTQQAIHRFDTVARVIMNRFFNNLVERGLAKDTPANRRNFLNQVGQYNARLMGPTQRALKQMGFSPFIVAGRTFNRQGRRLITGNPGFEAASKGAAVQARLTQMAGTAAILTLPMILNSITTGRPGGRPGTPIGAWDTGQNDERGKMKIVDLAHATGERRGLRVTGLSALIEGKRLGKDANTIAGNAVMDAGQAIAHPWVGPAVGFVYATLTGRRLDLRGDMQAQVVPEGGGKQYVENARAALESQNPLLYSAIRPELRNLGIDKEVTGLSRGKEFKEGAIAPVLGALGLKSVKAGTTAAQDLAHQYMMTRMPEGMTASTAAKLPVKREILDKIKAAPDDAQDILADAVDAGKLNAREASMLGQKAGKSTLQWDIRPLKPDEAMNVWAKANDDEKREIYDPIYNKIWKSKAISPDLKEQMLDRLDAEQAKTQSRPASSQSSR